MVLGELSEKLPILAQQLPPKSLNISHSHAERSKHTQTTANYSSSNKGSDSRRYLSVPRGKKHQHRELSFDSKRGGSLFDESQDIHSQSFLEPSSLRNESQMLDPYHPQNLSPVEPAGKHPLYRRSPSPFTDKTKSSGKSMMGIVVNILLRWE